MQIKHLSSIVDFLYDFSQIYYSYIILIHLPKNYPFRVLFIY
jgi:hypothetical protein